MTEEVVRDFRLTGDAYYNNYTFDQALQAYQRALGYVAKQQTPQLWAAIMLDLGTTHTELGDRTTELDIHTHLTAAVRAYNQALEVYTRETLPQDWAMTQNNLGNALGDQGIRTGGERGTQLLAEAVAAYRQALEVRTRETLPVQWAQTHNNLAKAYVTLEDWPNAAASYANVLQVYPDEEEAYRTASGIYHDILFQFPEAFALNQHWLERHPEELSDDFKVTWTFKGTRHFIDHSAQLAPYRTWLGQLFTAMEAEDRQTVLTGIQTARTGFQTVAEVGAGNIGIKVEWHFPKGKPGAIGAYGHAP